MTREMKEFFDIVFVVLVYRNVSDLKSFLSTNIFDKTITFKVIVVSSFYDEETDSQLKIVADSHNSVFLSVPNKGYGYGNNRGCEYALNNFDFEYLIISNADVLIQQFDVDSLQAAGRKIIAPSIRNLKGKKQNPNAPYKPSKFKDHIRYLMLKGNHSKLIWILYAYSRLQREFFFLINLFKKRSKVYSAHGSFVIFPYAVINDLFPLYNEKMFLLAEEDHLAKLAESRGIETIYVPSIKILHKEDGSISLLDRKIFELEQQSFMEYYTTWYTPKTNVMSNR